MLLAGTGQGSKHTNSIRSRHMYSEDRSFDADDEEDPNYCEQHNVQDWINSQSQVFFAFPSDFQSTKICSLCRDCLAALELTSQLDLHDCKWLVMPEIVSSTLASSGERRNRIEWNMDRTFSILTN
jgi:hypothetical protein